MRSGSQHGSPCFPWGADPPLTPQAGRNATLATPESASPACRPSFPWPLLLPTSAKSDLSSESYLLKWLPFTPAWPLSYPSIPPAYCWKFGGKDGCSTHSNNLKLDVSITALETQQPFIPLGALCFQTNVSPWAPTALAHTPPPAFLDTPNCTCDLCSYQRLTGIFYSAKNHLLHLHLLAAQSTCQSFQS